MRLQSQRNGSNLMCILRFTHLSCKHGIAVCLMYRCNPRHTAGYNTMSFDKLYGDGMDFIGNKGFTRLAWNRDG